MFLSSPCRNQFISWSKCVDAAKAAEKNFVEECTDCFEPLIRCQGENIDYFNSLAPKDGEEKDEEDDDITDDESSKKK